VKRFLREALGRDAGRVATPARDGSRGRAHLLRRSARPCARATRNWRATRAHDQRHCGPLGARARPPGRRTRPPAAQGWGVRTDDGGVSIEGARLDRGAGRHRARLLPDLAPRRDRTQDAGRAQRPYRDRRARHPRARDRVRHARQSGAAGKVERRDALACRARRGSVRGRRGAARRARPVGARRARDAGRAHGGAGRALPARSAARACPARGARPRPSWPRRCAPSAPPCG
jgi:hypothetical protein